MQPPVDKLSSVTFSKISVIRQIKSPEWSWNWIKSMQPYSHGQVGSIGKAEIPCKQVNIPSTGLRAVDCTLDRFISTTHFPSFASV